MSDSHVRDHLDEKHGRDREQRIEAVTRWVEYIQSEPADVWGPQQNAVVNGQLEAAQDVNVSAVHRQHVEAVAADIVSDRDDGAE